ncbi:MAG: rane-flanked domain [Acidobacteria bacterium]|nr:rane-flanked domain [Acidobacteriota bacterium]
MSFTRKQLLPGETLIVLARQHLLKLVWPFLLNGIVLILLAWLSIRFENAWILLLYLPLLAYVLWEYIAWRSREYILTDRRVVIQEGVFSISSFDATLDKINNVYHRQSFMGRLFRYGEVGLETASEQGTTVFSFLSHPLDFKNAIVQQREMVRADARQVASPQISVPQLLDELASLRDRGVITEDEFQEKKKSLLEKI